MIADTLVSNFYSHLLENLVASSWRGSKGLRFLGLHRDMLKNLPSWVNKGNLSKGSCQGSPQFFWPTAGKEGRPLTETVPRLVCTLASQKLVGRVEPELLRMECGIYAHSSVRVLVSTYFPISHCNKPIMHLKQNFETEKRRKI